MNIEKQSWKNWIHGQNISGLIPRLSEIFLNCLKTHDESFPTTRVKIEDRNRLRCQMDWNIQ